MTLQGLADQALQELLAGGPLQLNKAKWIADASHFFQSQLHSGNVQMQSQIAPVIYFFLGVTSSTPSLERLYWKTECFILESWSNAERNRRKTEPD